MFQRAVRERAFIKLAVTGPSGSGKTYSALRLAFGLGSKVAVLDTENRSASLYAGVGRDGIAEYDVADIEPPFATHKFINAINDAVKSGYDVLIIDTFSHAWSGPGGLLEQKDALDQRGAQGDRNNKNRFTNWGPITKLSDELNATILQAPIHIIACMRSKMEYQADGSGKVQKLGMAPVARDGVEYEFTLVFDVAMSHQAIASKDRTTLFRDLNAVLTEDHGRQIRDWLESGCAPAPRPEPPRQEPQRTAPAPSNGRLLDAPAETHRPESSGDRAAQVAPAGDRCPECNAPAGKHGTKCSRRESATPAEAH